jgi:foldase protein PrsA
MKKALVAIAISTSLFILSACGNEEAVVESSAGNVTKEELYKEMKKSQAGQNALYGLTLEKIMTKKYEVTDAEVDKAVQQYKDQSKDNGKFEDFLKQSGFKDEKEFKEKLKGQLAIEKGMKTSITEEELETANKEPKYSHILIKTGEGKDPAAAEAKAKEIKQKVDAGEDFATLAKENSEDTGSKEKGGFLDLPIDQTVPEFKEAASKLEPGKVTDLVKTEYGYHIIKRHEEKAVADLTEEEKDALQKSILPKKQQDGSIQAFFQKEIDEAKVNVKDEAFKDLFKAPEKPAEEPKKEETKTE